MQTFYLSMAADLLGVYIEYQAENQKALHQYLERQYLRNGVWKIPWCAVYTAIPQPSRLSTLPVHIVKAQCGTIHEEMRRHATVASEEEIAQDVAAMTPEDRAKWDDLPKAVDDGK